MVQTYGQYKRAIKRLGGKRIATRKEFKIIQARIQKIHKKTLRSKSIEKTLRLGGLTEKEIAQLRSK